MSNYPVYNWVCVGRLSHQTPPPLPQTGPEMFACSSPDHVHMLLRPLTALLCFPGPSPSFNKPQLTRPDTSLFLVCYTTLVGGHWKQNRRERDRKRKSLCRHRNRAPSPVIPSPGPHTYIDNARASAYIPLSCRKNYVQHIVTHTPHLI